MKAVGILEYNGWEGLGIFRFFIYHIQKNSVEGNFHSFIYFKELRYMFFMIRLLKAWYFSKIPTLLDTLSEKHT